MWCTYCTWVVTQHRGFTTGSNSNLVTSLEQGELLTLYGSLFAFYSCIQSEDSAAFKCCYTVDYLSDRNSMSKYE